MAELRALAIGGNQFPFHQFDDFAPVLVEFLGAQGVDVDATTDREALTDLASYDVVIDYVTDSTLTDEQREGLLSFVRDGGGYAGIHCASDLRNTAADDPEDRFDTREEPFPALRELLGGHFLTHPEQSEFDVTYVDREHPVSEGLADFTVHDEPYDLAVDPDVRVLARMDHPDLGDVPVAWVKPCGDGRVFYCSLGHTEDAQTSTSVHALLGRGVRWAGGVDPAP